MNVFSVVAGWDILWDIKAAAHEPSQFWVQLQLGVRAQAGQSLSQGLKHQLQSAVCPDIMRQLELLSKNCTFVCMSNWAVSNSPFSCRYQAYKH